MQNGVMGGNRSKLGRIWGRYGMKMGEGEGRLGEKEGMESTGEEMGG